MSTTTTANLGNGSAGAPSADIQYAAKRRPPNSARFVQVSIDCLVRQSNDSATGSAPSQDQRSNDPSGRGLPSNNLGDPRRSLAHLPGLVQLHAAPHPRQAQHRGGLPVSHFASTNAPDAPPQESRRSMG